MYFSLCKTDRKYEQKVWFVKILINILEVKFSNQKFKHNLTHQNLRVLFVKLHFLFKRPKSKYLKILLISIFFPSLLAKYW